MDTKDALILDLIDNLIDNEMPATARGFAFRAKMLGVNVGERETEVAI